MVWGGLVTPAWLGLFSYEWSGLSILQDGDGRQRSEWSEVARKPRFSDSLEETLTAPHFPEL